MIKVRVRDTTLSFTNVCMSCRLMIRRPMSTTEYCHTPCTPLPTRVCVLFCPGFPVNRGRWQTAITLVRQTNIPPRPPPPPPTLRLRQSYNLLCGGYPDGANRRRLLPYCDLSAERYLRCIRFPTKHVRTMPPRAHKIRNNVVRLCSPCEHITDCS